MARTYRLGIARRLVNAIVTPLTRFGLGGSSTYVLTVRGRTTGQPHSTPVTIMEEHGRRWLVAPYGPVSWVKNARAAGEVELSRRGRTERCKASELGPQESVPVLRMYLEKVPVARPYFDVAPESSDEDVARIALLKPVFELSILGEGV
jgi:deazaflavin-dependent oxidoreductase (nitroreductase family)